MVSVMSYSVPVRAVRFLTGVLGAFPVNRNGTVREKSKVEGSRPIASVSLMIFARASATCFGDCRRVCQPSPNHATRRCAAALEPPINKGG
jgi:hypothetical protein